jgi:large subunit ribosomal protein L21e
MRRSKGKLSKRSRLLGRGKKLGISKLMSSFSVGDEVSIDSQSRESGMPHPRYRGRRGKVVGMQGKACIVRIRDGNMEKDLIIPPIHLRK